MLQLCEVQEKAAWLAKQNAALERELRDARGSLSDVGPSSAPSTFAASVEGPVVGELGRIGVMLPTATGLAIHPLSLLVTLSAISLHANGRDIGRHEVYRQVEDTLTPTRSQFQSIKEGFQFDVKEDVEFGDPS